MFDTLIFDMGNVVLHFSHEQMCAQVAGVCGVDASTIRRLLFGSGWQLEFERGQISERDLHGRLQRELGRQVDFDALVLAGSDIFSLNAPLVSVLASVRQRGCRLVLLSNTSVSHFRFVRERFEVLGWFDEYVLSYEVGALKPESKIYEAALAAARCPPERCFYTDDIAEYEAAARRHGLCASVFTGVDGLLSDWRELGFDPEGNRSQSIRGTGTSQTHFSALS